jgi:hypothetical protein
VLYTMQNRSFLEGDSYEYCNSFEVNLYNFFFCLCCFYFFLSQDSNQMFFLGYDNSSFL